MIWTQLALFAVSFILTALLAPKPEFENARPDELDPENFPRATEDAPVPLLFGCARIKGPNTLWYGDYVADPITKKQKTGLFSSTNVIIGHKYYLTLDMGLCLGPAFIKQIYIDSEPVAPGITSVVDEDIELYGDPVTGGINSTQTPPETGPGTYPWITSFDAVSDSSPEYYNLVTDLGFAAEAIDNGLYGAYAAQQPAHGTGSGLFLPTTGTFWFQMRFYAGDNGTGGEFVSERLQLNSYEILVTSSGSFVDGALQELTKTQIPAGTRSIGIISFTNMQYPVTDEQLIKNHVFRVTGKAIQYDEQYFDINEPELFGGNESGGGWIGDVSFYAGIETQPVDPDVEASIGAGLVPAYNGVSHVVFPNNYIGETPSLRKTEFLMGSYTDYLTNGNAGQCSALNEEDASAAETLYRAIVDDWTGMDIDPTKLNLTTFTDADITLQSENHGVSGVVSSPQEGKKTLREILRQIDGVLAENASGEIELRLIRDDYVAASLPVYDEDDIEEIVSYQRTSWADVISEVKVSYSQRDQESSKVAVEQNPATLSMVGRKTVELSFPFCYRSETAQELAARELSRLSVPLIRMSVKMNRNAYGILVGDVIKITFPEMGITELIMRVQKTSLGLLDNNIITLELVQDIYAVNTAVFSTPVDTGWVDSRPTPVTIPNQEVVEMPYFFSSTLEEPVSDGYAVAIPFAEKPQTASGSYTFVHDATVPVVDASELGFVDPVDIVYPLQGDIVTAYSDEEGYSTGTDTTTGIVIQNVIGQADDIPVAATAAEIATGGAGLIYANGEWMGYETVTDNLDGTYTIGNIHRGLLGTQPVAHTVDSSLWFLNPDLLGAGASADAILDSGSIWSVMLDRTGAVRRSPEAETAAETTLNELADRPLRPRDLQLDSVRTLDHDFASDPSVSVSWVSSNRAATSIPDEDDATETPDQTETYDIEVWIDGVDESVTYGVTGASSPQVVDVTGVTGSTVEIRVYSRRTVGNLATSAYYAFARGKLDTLELVSGDMVDTAGDYLLTSGDEQSGTDGIKMSGDEA